jgi:hypothetical protein
MDGMLQKLVLTTHEQEWRNPVSFALLNRWNVTKTSFDQA